MKNLVRIAIEQIPLVCPKHIARLIVKEPGFYPLQYYWEDVKPINGEIGIYNGHRIIINSPASRGLKMKKPRIVFEGKIGSDPNNPWPITAKK